MALTCPSDLSGVDLFPSEFIDCSTLSISYDQLGTATLSFTVVAPVATPSRVYTDLTFGKVNFKGFVSSLDIRRIPGTLVFEHNYTVNAVGCRV